MLHFSNKWSIFSFVFFVTVLGHVSAMLTTEEYLMREADSVFGELSYAVDSPCAEIVVKAGDRFFNFIVKIADDCHYGHTLKEYYATLFFWRLENLIPLAYKFANSEFKGRFWPEHFQRGRLSNGRLPIEQEMINSKEWARKKAGELSAILRNLEAARRRRDEAARIFHARYAQKKALRAQRQRDAELAEQQRMQQEALADLQWLLREQEDVERAEYYWQLENIAQRVTTPNITK